MNIGRLDRKIVIEQRSGSKNDFGESVDTWTTYHSCFARLQKGGGNERNEADKTTATRMVKFKIRYFDGIDETMRVSYNGDYYEITQIQELGREGLWLHANKKQ